MAKVNSFLDDTTSAWTLVLMLLETIENRGPFIKQPQNGVPMSGAEQWLTFPLLDSYLKLLQLKHTGIGEGKKKK